mmetsp:Transcript_71406/g.209627  ORF Transcript_71406/g.209627 Transcript_71406/m.209627 type:complete len:203 (+) Transcript_71406:649-1257(+)
MPEAHGAIVAAGDDEQGALPHARDRAPVRAELPQHVLLARLLLSRPAPDVAVVVADDHLAACLAQDRAARWRLQGCHAHGHVVGEIREGNLASVGDRAYLVARWAEGDVGDLAGVRGRLKRGGEVRGEEPPHLPVPRRRDELGAVGGGGEGHDANLKDVLGEHVPVCVVALDRLDAAIAARHVEEVAAGSDTRHPVVAHGER